MKKLQNGPELVINIPTRLRYYIDSIAILLGATIVCLALIYVGIAIRG